VLKQMDAQAAGFQSLTADLERTKVTVVVNDKSTQSGQIFVRGDGKMRIELTQPDPQTILRDGDNFYIYNPKIHRVEEYNLGKKKALVDQFLLLGFGTSGSSLKESYTISLAGEESLDNHKVIRLDLLPKTDDVRKQLSKIQLWLDETTSLSSITISSGTCAFRITISSRTGRAAPPGFSPRPSTALFSLPNRASRESEPVVSRRQMGPEPPAKPNSHRQSRWTWRFPPAGFR
jgi:outer membrane lipoprotein-sorting protein